MKLLHVYADAMTEVESVDAGHICAVVGLRHTRTGDTLVGAKGDSLATTKQLVDSLADEVGKELEVEVERDGRRRRLSVVVETVQS